MRRVLLDTQAFVMAATEAYKQMPKRVQRLLGYVETERLLSAVSISEVAIKTSIGKLNFSSEMIASAARDLKLVILPFTPRHAARMFRLPLHHRGPFDRMILATALVEDLALVGGDEKFPAYKSEGLEVIW
jgi:PIN domain nuclease of toxin-antitoxin system